MPRSIGLLCAHRAAQPATCEAAMLVPFHVAYRLGIGTQEKISTPGAAMSTLP